MINATSAGYFIIPVNFDKRASIMVTVTSFQTPEDPKAKFLGYIPIEELDITYCRSGSAGGQHVNRVNTKVDLRFNVQNAKWLSDEVKEKILEQVTQNFPWLLRRNIACIDVASVAA